MRIAVQKKPSHLTVDARVTSRGITISLNDVRMPIIYPEEIWRAYPQEKKELLCDALALSSTFFVPQILGIQKIIYKTRRSFIEPHLFENGLYDMSNSAHTDGVSSMQYVKAFINTVRSFDANDMRQPQSCKPISQKKKRVVIPFTFGKESLLSYALARDIGLDPILVYVKEPAHRHESHHKIELAKQFEKETGTHIWMIDYAPGIMRYGALWGLETELGWGLQTTEYAILSLPFVAHGNAETLILGNEHSCSEASIDEEGILTHWTGYDQHSDWTPHQSMLASLLVGHTTRVISFVEPLHELAEIKILYQRYPLLARYQTSCLAQSASAAQKRWCEQCEKCACMYLFCVAVGADPVALGFKQNLLDKQHSSLFNSFFHQTNEDTFYGLIEEVEYAFYLALKRGIKGYSVTLFETTILPAVLPQIPEYTRMFFGIHPSRTLPNTFKKPLSAIFKKELDVKNI